MRAPLPLLNVALIMLAALSAVRIVTELIYDLLVAVGWTRRILLVQCAWVAFLAPMLVLGAYRDGVRGVAVAHVAVALLVALPLYVLAIRKVGIATGRVLRAAIPAAIASLLVAAVVLTLEALVKSPALLLLVGLPLCVAVAVGSQWRVLKPFLAIYARQARVHAQA